MSAVPPDDRPRARDRASFRLDINDADDDDEHDDPAAEASEPGLAGDAPSTAPTLPPQPPMPVADLIRIAAERKQLAANGYAPVSLLSHTDPDQKKAGKKPHKRHWVIEARQEPPEDARYSRALEIATNTGIATHKKRAIDIDCGDPDRADAIAALAEKHCGKTIVRFRRNSARRAFLYRAAEGEPRKIPLTGTTYSDSDEPDRIEVLGAGQQLAALGTHVTGVPIEWTASPLVVPCEMLPAVTEAQIAAFLAEAAPLIGATWKAPATKTKPQRTEKGNGALPADLGRVREMLMTTVPSDDRGEWIAVGAALYHETDGSEEGCAIWNDWSAKSAKYKAAEIPGVWDSFARDSDRNAGFGKIYFLAKNYGYKPPPSVFNAPGFIAAQDAADAEDRTRGNGPTPEPRAPELPSDEREALDDPDLSVLRLSRRQPPPFPLEVLGPHWAKWIADAADAAVCPVDYAVAPLLSSTSTLIGHARWAQATPKWTEPPHVWTCPVGDSGDGKSPGSDPFLKDVLPEIERRMRGNFPERHKEWLAIHERHEAAMEAWRKSVREAEKNDAPTPPPPDDNVGLEPMAPCVRTNDVTIERVARMLVTAAPKGLMIVRDEVAGWLLGMTQYNDAGRQFWIEAYGGRPYRVDRVKHPEPIEIPRLAVAVFGGVQPERLAELFRDPDDGLLARILWFWPDPCAFRLGKAVPHTDWAIAALDRLRQLEPHNNGPLFVPLEAAALPFMEEFGREMQERKQEAGGLMRSACGKARGTALRLSLDLEHLWWCGAGKGLPPAAISVAAFTAAAQLVSDYFLPMAERVYGDAAAPPVERNAATLARWIVKTQAREVSTRRLQRVVRLPGLRDAETIHAVCKYLVDAGWLWAPKRGFAEASRSVYIVNRLVLERAEGWL
jgi:hypothetical protein